MRHAIALCIGLMLAGCAVQVKPWERGTLAKPHMAIVPSSTEAASRHHVFDSKEGSFGGLGAGGGGCGCN
jgi:hypothetical protein